MMGVRVLGLLLIIKLIETTELKFELKFNITSSKQNFSIKSFFENNTISFDFSTDVATSKTDLKFYQDFEKRTPINKKIMDSCMTIFENLPMVIVGTQEFYIFGCKEKNVFYKTSYIDLNYEQPWVPMFHNAHQKFYRMLNEFMSKNCSRLLKELNDENSDACPTKTAKLNTQITATNNVQEPHVEKYYIDNHAILKCTTTYAHPTIVYLYWVRNTETLNTTKEYENYSESERSITKTIEINLTKYDNDDNIKCKAIHSKIKIEKDDMFENITSSVIATFLFCLFVAEFLAIIIICIKFHRLKIKEPIADNESTSESNVKSSFNYKKLKNKTAKNRKNKSYMMLSESSSGSSSEPAGI
ncbi:hypothetical protein MRV_0098 [Murid herpesvirus 3]|uniref:Ig-like domain-containing protein n=2 Tax=Murid betaherpesvirus 3 TaxID=2560603 RepID=A0A1P8VIX7_9BETA|nr:hypothetical protein MRV_0098 [Murine roseolovirus]APZ76309.1 hypothetical protein MRV_0098 [Murid betaherpesvirus 3]AYH64753.1 hypothetical protein MRV_0098 [Murid herpesvirus 3]